MGKTGAERYAGPERCRAVLWVWSGRRTGTRVCAELGIGWGVLNQWEEQAMEGMLEALAPRGPGKQSEGGPSLPPKLRRLMERKVLEKEAKLPRLTRRLASVSGERKEKLEKPEKGGEG